MNNKLQKYKHMKICKTINETTSLLSIFINDGKKIGFVPTMGALHKGHISLINISKKQNDITVVSIFVNPTQFNDKQDYIKYPRNSEKDLEMLSNTGCDLVFMPDDKEMYPEPDNRIFDLGNLETIMEGKFRPGHFQCVAGIVSKLFDIIKPDKAYFGQKDFQQLSVIKRLVQITNSKVQIISCPIIREENGLALSSRNLRLSVEEFKQAAIIYKTINQLSTFLENNKFCEFKTWAIKQIDKISLFKTEYIEIVDTETLGIVKDIKYHKSITCCIAVYCGQIRLIDNIQINL